MNSNDLPNVRGEWILDISAKIVEKEIVIIHLHLIVNNHVFGEGGIWVCNTNGNFEQW